MSGVGNGPAFESIDAIQRWVFERLLEDGASAAPRAIPTRELLGQTFTLMRPRARIVGSPARRWSLPLAIGEFCWHTSASDDVDALAYYAPRWRAFSVDGRTIRGSCYGRRIFAPGPNGISRWDALIELLKDDPATRRAVIDLSGGNPLDAREIDASCVSTLQVFVRAGTVHALVYMRSNDAVWGLPYDIFLFTMIQEMLARSLGLMLGSYVHMVGSLHLYDTHLALAQRVLADSPPPTTEMSVMGPVSELGTFLAAERAIRLGTTPPPLTQYWAGLAEALLTYSAKRRFAATAISAR